MIWRIKWSSSDFFLPFYKLKLFDSFISEPFKQKRYRFLLRKKVKLTGTTSRLNFIGIFIAGASNFPIKKEEVNDLLCIMTKKKHKMCSFVKAFRMRRDGVSIYILRQTSKKFACKIRGHTVPPNTIQSRSDRGLNSYQRSSRRRCQNMSQETYP